MENLGPPPPQIKDEKWRFFSLHTASSLIWRVCGFAVPFYFVQDCSSEDDFSPDIKQPVPETGDWCHIWETPRYI